MAGYGDDNGFKEWLDENGYDLDANPTPAAVLRQRGSAYVDGVYGPQVGGTPTGGFAQERAQPRSGASAGGEGIPSDVIPQAWIEASYYAAYREGLKPGILATAVTPAKAVKRVKTGTTEIEFADSGNAVTGATTVFSYIEGLLAPFMASDEAAVFIV